MTAKRTHWRLDDGSLVILDGGNRWHSTVPTVCQHRHMTANEAMTCHALRLQEQRATDPGTVR
jgi:hypothetical protein